MTRMDGYQLSVGHITRRKAVKSIGGFLHRGHGRQLDLNAAGSREQADDVAFNQGRANGGINNRYAICAIT